MSPRLRRWLSGALVTLAVAYPLTLLVCALLLRFVGERWWVTGVMLFLPRFGFVLPLPLLVAAIAGARRFRLLWSQVAALCVLWPMLGFTLSSPFAGGPDAQAKLRVLSYNVNSGYGGFDGIAAEIA